MDILITNDDGIHSDGITALCKALKKTARVTVVAPDTERSAVGHAITISDPLRVKKIYKGGNFFGYASNGTPADCVKLGVRAIMKKKPDMVFSGINIGANLGYNILYSGTVSGATEGAIHGITSVAISLCTFKNPDFSFAAEFAVRLAKILKEKKMPTGSLLNVNIPAVSKNKIKGVKITNQSKSFFVDSFDIRKDPRQRVYYWLAGELNSAAQSANGDLPAVKKNFVSITPIQFDLTDYDFISELKDWKI